MFEQTFNNIDNVLRQEAGCSSELDYTEQSSWMLFHKYLDDLDGELPCNLFDTVISEIEQPMLKTVLRHCDNNQSKTASCLGINRGTLRKKLKQYHIEH